MKAFPGIADGGVNFLLSFLDRHIHERFADIGHCGKGVSTLALLLFEMLEVGGWNDRRDQVPAIPYASAL